MKRMKRAENADVFSAGKLEETISQSPPIGSLTHTVMASSLWLRTLISCAYSETRFAICL